MAGFVEVSVGANTWFRSRVETLLQKVAFAADEVVDSVELQVAQDLQVSLALNQLEILFLAINELLRWRSEKNSYF